MVGGLLLAFTAITVALSYVDFGAVLSHLFHTNLSEGQGRKANVAVALLVATFKAGLVAAIFMHLVGGKEPDLSRSHFHRLFRLRTFLAHLSRLVRPDSPLMSLKGFHIVFIVFSTLLALGIGCYCVWVDLTVGEPVYRTGAIVVLCLGRGADRLRRLVLSENETAAFDHMKAIFVSAVLFCASLTQSVRPAPPASEIMPTLAVRLRQTCSTWPSQSGSLMCIVMSVLGGIGAFSFHLWRHARHAARAARAIDRGRFIAI